MTSLSDLITSGSELRRNRIVQRHLGRARDRGQRYQAYADFQKSAPDLFNQAEARTPEMHYFNLYYSFAVVSGGVDGGLDDRVLDVIFGNKPFESTFYGPPKLVGGEVRRSSKTLSERGASLRYIRQDTGRVLCFLYPAETEHQRPIEDMILLREISNPKRLLKWSHLKCDLLWLTAYMASTSLDGAITPLQRLRVFWLWLFKRRHSGGILHHARALLGLAQVLKWSLTVGLSGLLLYFIQLHWPPPDNVTPAVTSADHHAHVDSAQLAVSLEALRVDLAQFRHEISILFAGMSAAAPDQVHGKMHTARDKSQP